MSAVLACIQGWTEKNIEATSQHVLDAAVYKIELHNLSQRYARVDLALYVRKTKAITTFKLGGKPNCQQAWLLDPVPVAILRMNDSAPGGKPPVESFFFETEEEAVLFKMKYEGARDDER